MAIIFRDKNNKILKKDDIVKYRHNYYLLDYHKTDEYWILLGLSTDRIILYPELYRVLRRSEKISTIENETVVDLIIWFYEKWGEN